MSGLTTTAMCVVEKQGDREYKVKDMAEADFGCAPRPSRVCFSLPAARSFRAVGS